MEYVSLAWNRQKFESKTSQSRRNKRALAWEPFHSAFVNLLI